MFVFFIVSHHPVFRFFVIKFFKSYIKPPAVIDRPKGDIC